MFWVDIELSNPLDTTITLTNFTATLTFPNENVNDLPQATVEVMDEISLTSKEIRIVSYGNYGAILCITELSLSGFSGYHLLQTDETSRFPNYVFLPFPLPCDRISSCSWGSFK